MHEADEVDHRVAEPVVLLDLLARRAGLRHGGAVKLQGHHDRVGELGRHLLQLRAAFPVTSVTQVAPACIRPCHAQQLRGAGLGVTAGCAGAIHCIHNAVLIRSFSKQPDRPSLLARMSTAGVDRGDLVQAVCCAT